MKIETLEEWNALMTGCGCCPLPVTPEVVSNYESLLGLGYVSGYIDEYGTMPERIARYESDENVNYAVTRFNRAGVAPDTPAGWTTFTRSSVLSATLGADSFQVFPPLAITVDVASSDPYGGGPESTTFEEGITTGDAKNQLRTLLSAAADFENDDLTVSANTTAFYVRKGLVFGETGGGTYPFAVVVLMFARWFWRVPSSHAGSYYAVTWQIAEEPAEGVATLTEDAFWIWAGPGTGDEDDPSWRSGYYDLTPPAEPGTRKVVNVRYQGMRSTRQGIKPQVMGEGYVLPPNKPSVRTSAAGAVGESGRKGKAGQVSGLKLGGLKIGGLKMGKLRMGGLKIGGLKTGTLKMGGLKMSGLKSSGGLKIKGLKSSGGLKIRGLKDSGGLKVRGVKVVGLKSSTGIRVNRIQASRMQSSSGLRQSGGLKTARL